MSFCATAEATLTLVLSTTIAYRLASAGLAAEAFALALLCAAACGLEYLRGGAPLASRAGCSMRPDAGAGLAVGASSPALVVAALVVARGPSPLLRAALQIQFCVRNAESGDAVALYDLKLSDVRKQVRASLPQKRAPRSGPSSPSEYGSHPAPRTATLRVPLRPPGSVHVSR